MSATLTIRLEDTVRKRLEKLAVATERSKSYLAAQAVIDYVKLQEWQIKEIKLGLQEADAGELVSHATVLNNWKKRHGNSLD